MNITRCFILVLPLLIGPSRSIAQPTAFTYEGQINEGLRVVNGVYDFEFRLFAIPIDDSPLKILDIDNIQINKRAFNVILDFGDEVFKAGYLWLEVAIRATGNTQGYVAAGPRSLILPVPYAIHALSASTASMLTGPLPDNLLSPNVALLDGSPSFRGTVTANQVAAQSLNVGDGHRLYGTYSSVAGGQQNVTFGDNSFIGGGVMNTLRGDVATIAGGFQNNISGDYSAVGGGWGNLVQGWYSSISGGIVNEIQSHSSVIGGGEHNLIEGTNGYSNSGNATIAGGYLNTIHEGAFAAAICGGFSNTIGSASAFIGGGEVNAVEGGGARSAIGGGFFNRSQGPLSFIGGGEANIVQTDADHCAIGAGWLNAISTGARAATISGGFMNVAGGFGSAIAGGGRNVCSNFYSMVPGGRQNLAAGDSSFAAGRRAKALHAGAFVWADATDADISSTRSNQFIVRASGGAQLLSSSDGSSGVELPPGGGAWANLSDRAAKQNFQAVNKREILTRLAQLEVQTWSYKTQEPRVRHLGPTAQDFRTAFGLGEDDRHINSADADGVAVAAIQGLYEMVLTQEREIQSLKQTVIELRSSAAKERLEPDHESVSR